MVGKLLPITVFLEDFIYITEFMSELCNRMGVLT